MPHITQLRLDDIRAALQKAADKLPAGDSSLVAHSLIQSALLDIPQVNTIRAAVESSDVRSMAYNETERVLDVEYCNGTLYRFYDVPRANYRAILSSDSIGSTLRVFIKTNHYIYRRLSK